MDRVNCKNQHIGICEHSGRFFWGGGQGWEQRVTENFLLKVILQIKISKCMKKLNAKSDTKQNQQL